MGDETAFFLRRRFGMSGGKMGAPSLRRRGQVRVQGLWVAAISILGVALTPGILAQNEAQVCIMLVRTQTARMICIDGANTL